MEVDTLRGPWRGSTKGTDGGRDSRRQEAETDRLRRPISKTTRSTTDRQWDRRRLTSKRISKKEETETRKVGSYDRSIEGRKHQATQGVGGQGTEDGDERHTCTGSSEPSQVRAAW